MRLHPGSDLERRLWSHIKPFTSCLRVIKELYHAIMLYSEPAGMEHAVLKALGPQPLSDVIKGAALPLGFSREIWKHHDLCILKLEIGVSSGLGQDLGPYNLGITPGMAGGGCLGDGCR